MLSFQFDLNKLIQALAFFSTRGVGELSRMKAAKLLYFSDKEHLLRYGRPILGDEYYALEMGPIPSRALDFMAEATEEVEIPDRERVERYLRIETGRYPEFVATTEPDLEVFSESEIEVLGEIVERYGGCTASRLVELTHAEPAWKRADEKRSRYGRQRIPYEDFFIESPNRDTLKLARAEQEDRDFAATFRR